MAYKFQKDFAILSGAIEPAANNDPTLALGGLTRAWSDLYMSGTLQGAAAVGTNADSIANGFFDHMSVTSSLTLPQNKFVIGSTAVTTTAAELNKLDGAGADVTAAKLTTLSALSDTEIGYLDGAGTAVVASKVVVATAGKDVTSLRSVTGSAIKLDGLAGPHALSASAGDIAVGKDLILGNAGQFSFSRAGALTAGAITGTTVSGSGNFSVGADLQLGVTGQYGIQRDGQLDVASMGTNWTNAGRTVANLGSITTVDINGGTADNVVIGGATAAAGTFTTLTANGNVVLGDATTDTITFTGQIANTTDLIPATDGGSDLGSNAKRFGTLYVDNIVGASTSFDTEYVAGGGTIAAATDFAICTSAGTVTLPAAAAGKYLYIKSSVDGNVVLAANSGDSFPEGAPTLRATGSAILCIAKDAASWFIL